MDFFVLCWRSTLVGLLVLGASLLYAIQPDVGLEANQDVTLGVGNGLFYEAKADGRVVASKGPIRPAHLFERIVKLRGVKTYVYLKGHYGTYLRYNTASERIEATGDPGLLDGVSLDPELMFVEWRLGRISHPMAGHARLPRQTGKRVLPKSAGVPAGTMTAGELSTREVIEGDVRIRTRRDLEKLFGFRRIKGSVSVDGTLLSHLDSLSTLVRVDGDLRIRGNAKLTSLHGLRSLASVGGHLEIESNAALQSLAGMGKLREVTGKLKLRGNASLSSLSAIGPLEALGDFELDKNPGLPRCEADGLFERPGFKHLELRILTHRLRLYGQAYKRACAEVVGEDTMQLLELIVRADDMRRVELRRWMSDNTKRHESMREGWLKRRWSVQAVRRFHQLGARLAQADLRSTVRKGAATKRLRRYRKARDKARGKGVQKISLAGWLRSPATEMPWDILRTDAHASRSRAGRDQARRRLAAQSALRTEPPMIFGSKPEFLSFGEGDVKASERSELSMAASSKRRAQKRASRALMSRSKPRSVSVFVLESLSRPGYYRVEWGQGPSERLKQHNEGRVMTTAHLRPFKIRHQLRFTSKLKAKRFVRYLQRSSETKRVPRVARTTKTRAALGVLK